MLKTADGLKFLCRSKLTGYCMLDSRRPEQDGDDNGTTGSETWLQKPPRRAGLDVILTVTILDEDGNGDSELGK